MVWSYIVNNIIIIASDSGIHMGLYRPLVRLRFRGCIDSRRLVLSFRSTRLWSSGQALHQERGGDASE